MNSVKKIALSVWLAFFLMLTIGVPLHKHYCGSSLYSVGPIVKSCCCEKMDATDKDHCCSTSTSYFALDQDYLGAAFPKVDVDFVAFFGAQPHLIFYLSKSVVFRYVEAIPTIEFPRKIPIFKLLHQFTFYN